MSNHGELRSINLKLFLTKDGQLENVEALPGEGYEVLDPKRTTDTRDICIEERVMLTDTAIVLVTQENPTCLRWKYRRTQNGWDVVCVKWRDE